MTRRLLALAFAALAGCGGMDALTAPTDAVLAAGIDSGAALDDGTTTDATAVGWWNVDLGQGQCGAGYVQKLYAPNEFAWCEGSPDAGGAPCGESTPIGWYRAGLYKCAKVTP